MEKIVDLLPHLIILGLLLFLSFFFSGSETALCSLSQIQIERMRKDKRKSRIAIVNFLEDSRRLFITILLGNNFVNIAFATVISSLIYKIFGGNTGLAIVLSTVFITIMLLIFGEITPKIYAVNYAEKFSSVTARALWFFSIIILPLRLILRYVVDLLLPIFGGREISMENAMTAEEFKEIVSSGEVEGVIEKREREIIEGIFELNDLEAREIMVPRTEIVGIEVNETIQASLDKAKSGGFSRIPVYREQMDNICGIFQVKDWPLWRKAEIQDQTIDVFLENYNDGKENDEDEISSRPESTLIRTAYFVPETKKLDALMRELTTSKNKMAILLDEYGGVSGLVTMEDIVEVLVGEIADEYDEKENPLIVWDKSNPSVVNVAGKVNIRTVNKRLDLSLDESIADTIGGYVVDLFGSIPPEGAVKRSEDGIIFEVLKVDGTRIDQIVIRRTPGVKRNP